jgi:hypothetical protein
VLDEVAADDENAICHRCETAVAAHAAA